MLRLLNDLAVPVRGFTFDYVLKTLSITILILWISIMLIGCSEEDPPPPPPGARIVFASDGEIWVMDADGENPYKLTEHGGIDPAWSPDGRRIAFMSNRDENWEIYVMHANGENQRNLTKNEVTDEYPAWSPDGRKIAFYSDRHWRDSSWYEAGGIYVMDADGKNPHRLVSTHRAGPLVPAWSPDGRRIAFVSERSVPGGGSVRDICVMDADGRNVYNLTNNSMGFSSDPTWSPDGQRIAYRSGWEIWVMDADGNNPCRLTNNPAMDLYPAWSPDGRIAFSSNRDGNFEIYVMDEDGKNLHNITNSPADDRYPDWFVPKHPIYDTGEVLAMVWWLKRATDY